MPAGVLQNAVSLLLAGVLLFYVSTRSERPVQRRVLLGLLVGLALWSGGAVLGLSAQNATQAKLSLGVGFLGVMLVPPLWLVLAASQARLSVASERLRTLLAVICVPSALAFLALLTNSWHRLVLTSDVTFGSPPGEVIQAAGPVFWAFTAWSQLCGFGGAVLLLASARQMGQSQRVSALVLSAAALLPLVANVLFVAQLLPTPHDPTPLALAISLALVSAAIFRFGLLDGTLPLARRDVLEDLADGLLIADTEGCVLDMNPAAARILGRSDLRGRSLSEALHVVDWDAGPMRLETNLTTAQDGAPPVATVLRTRDDRWIELRSAVVRGSDDEPAGQYVVLHDRTSEQRYQRFVHQSQKLETVGGMVAGIAHEVNNPLAYVRSNLHALLGIAHLVDERLDSFSPGDRPQLAEMRDIIDETLDGVERIARIVDGLRRFSRPHSDDAVPVDLNAVARQAIRLAELHANRKVTVTPKLAQLPPVKGSSDRLGQVVLNLLMNAKQALTGRPFGRIVVETLAQHGGVELHVSDNGPGIPEDIQDRIFDPFFTTKAPDEGTGLGLSIAFDIVREHGGSLEIASRTGEGARFIVRLPAA
jgi:PAS domain S-box-containing protein